MCEIEVLEHNLIRVECQSKSIDIQDGDRFEFTEDHGVYQEGDVIEVEADVDLDGGVFDKREYFLRVWPIEDKSEQLRRKEWICDVFCNGIVQRA